MDDVNNAPEPLTLSVEEQAKAAIDRLLRFPRWTREGEPMALTVERTALVMDVLTLVQKVNRPLPPEAKIPLLQALQGWEDLIALDEAVVSRSIARFNQQNYRAPTRKTRVYANRMGNGLIAPEVKYAPGMEIGEQWREGHSTPLAVNDYGDFVDGQTRVFAVGLYIEEHPGAIVRMRIRLGVHPLDADVIDVNEPRTEANALDFKGFPRDPNKVVTAKKAQDVANKARMGLLGGKGKKAPKTNKKEANKLALPYWSVIFHVIYALARVDLSSVVFTPTSVDAAANYKKTKTRRAQWRPDVAAPFFRAALGEWPLASVLGAADRFAREDWIPGRDDDPLKQLHFKIQKKSRQKRAMYPFAVAALRAELQGRALAELEEAEYDFAAPWEPGYATLAEHENRRRALKAVLARYTTKPEVVEAVNEAADLLANARALGMAFTLVPTTGEDGARGLNCAGPKGFPTKLAKDISEAEDVIRELVIEEVQPAAPTSSATPVAISLAAVPPAVIKR